MAVFEGSRFKGSYIFIDDSKSPEISYISPFRDNIYTAENDDLVITFEDGMELDKLAFDYYGNTDLDWIIFDANPKYLTPYDIKVGEQIVIPNPERVLEVD